MAPYKLLCYYYYYYYYSYYINNSSQTRGKFHKISNSPTGDETLKTFGEILRRQRGRRLHITQSSNATITACYIYTSVSIAVFFVPIGKWRFCPTGTEQTVVSLHEVSWAIQMIEMVPLQWKQLKKHCDRVRDIEIMTFGQKTWHIYSMNCKAPRWDSSK